MRLLHGRVDDGRPGECPSDDGKEIERDRHDDPLPAHRAECVADRREAVAPPPEHASDCCEKEKPERHTRHPAEW